LDLLSVGSVGSVGVAVAAVGVDDGTKVTFVSKIRCGLRKGMFWLRVVALSFCAAGAGVGFEVNGMELDETALVKKVDATGLEKLPVKHYLQTVVAPGHLIVNGGDRDDVVRGDTADEVDLEFTTELLVVFWEAQWFFV
jgi:hypothetical protein